jgi:hypothetical protein
MEEFVENVLGRDVSEEAKDEMQAAETASTDEISPAVLVEDYFSPVRCLVTNRTVRVCYIAVRIFGANRIFVAALILVTSNSPRMMGCRCYFIGEEHEDSGATLQSLAQFAWGVAFLLASAIPPELARVINPDTGALVLLGAGTKKVSARAHKALMRWRTVFSVSLVPMGLAGCMFTFWAGLVAAWKMGVDLPISMRFFKDVDHDMDRDTGSTALNFANVIVLLGTLPVWPIICWLLAPLCSAWLFSLKIGACLADYDVAIVIQRTTAAALQSDENWDRDVAKPTIQLAKTTMHHLTAGWGRGVGMFVLFLWTMAFNRFAEFLYETYEIQQRGLIDDERADAFLNLFVRKALMGGILLLTPLVVAVELATVSSLCDTLAARINEFGLDWKSTTEANEISRKTRPLLETLHQLNHGQGLGFQVFGVVVDRKMLTRLVASVSSIFFTVVPIVMAMQPQLESATTSSTLLAPSCALSAAQKHAIESMAQAILLHSDSNMSHCSYNLTLTLGL